ncbi:MAG: glycoside hydrolase 43 family protein [Planctomycetota bacterium]|nr:glycoside hydrolase 43 family protein [Planctomycetota bacterium]
MFVLALLAAGLARSQAAPPSPATEAAPHIYSWGDQGDGTYRNPIIKSDYSDPDICRVGSDFYLIASDFAYVGMQVMHSKDLVNWEVIGQVFNRLTMDPKYDQMKGYGEGTWAPSLRFHNGEFYIYVCTPYEGLFMWHTKNPAGPWSDTVTVKKVPRWEDPCPLWDDDGQAYLVHSLKGAGPLIINKMSADGTQLLDDGKEIYRGRATEGPKFYKRHGYYYICMPEGGVSTGGQSILRSKTIYGPYERRQVLPNGTTHQGGMVELDNGQGWFISFKQTGFLGRICYLNPVTWGSDDWPVFGDNGKPVTVWKKPEVGNTFPVSKPPTSDEFDSPQLAPIWQWNHNPVPKAWSLTARPGFLRLTALPATQPSTARNTLTEKIWDVCGVINVKMDVSKLTDGDRAGFAFMSGASFGWVGVAQDKSQRHFMWDQTTGPAVAGDTVYLRGIYHNDIGRLYYSADGNVFSDSGQTFRLRFASWKGARVGVICFNQANDSGEPASGGGTVDFDYFHYRYGAAPVEAGFPAGID